MNDLGVGLVLLSRLNAGPSHRFLSTFIFASTIGGPNYGIRICSIANKQKIETISHPVLSFNWKGGFHSQTLLRTSQ
jgi:hypothetical protein